MKMPIANQCATESWLTCRQTYKVYLLSFKDHLLYVAAFNLHMIGYLLIAIVKNVMLIIGSVLIRMLYL